MTRSAYEHDPGATVVCSFGQLLAAVGAATLAELEEWADSQTESCVTLTPGGDDLAVTLDSGASAVLEYPFSVEFLSETIEDLSRG